jgi:ABC-type glycerol-3-phosphate transport system substrate-binding protein
MSNFQTVLIAIFLSFFVFAVLIFSGFLPIGNSSDSTTLQGNVIVWGVFPSVSISKFIENMNASNPNLIIKYVQKSKDTYKSDLIEAFADGSGPDLFFVSPDMIVKYQKFIYPMPYTSYPAKNFSDNFIDGSSIYLAKDGELAMPVLSDPLVLYYNKNILNNASIVKPPQYWDELFNMNDVLTVKSNDGIITQSMIALGSFDNVNNAKDIISLLLIGSGDDIIRRDPTDDKYRVVLKDKTAYVSSPVETAMKFFNEFSNPNDQAYSWNRSLPNSKDMFTSGKLAFYIGRSSELFNIQSVNPNLSFDVAPVPQIRSVNMKRTTGPIYGIAINKKSSNVSLAASVAGMFSLSDNAKEMSAALSIPPAQKDLLATNPTDPYLFTFYKSAISLYTWPDPDTTITDGLFRELVQNLISNKLSVIDSINKIENQLDLLVNPQ